MLTQLIAQSTQPATGGWQNWGVSEWLLIGGFICATLLPAIAAFLNSIRNRQAIAAAQVQTNTNTNNQSVLATNMNLMQHAQNASPGPPESYVSPAVIESTRQIAVQPQTPADPPIPPVTLPISTEAPAPRVQT